MEDRVGNQASSPFDQHRTWLEERWAEWRRINGVGPSERLTYAHYRAFDAWLALCSARSQLDPGAAIAARSAA